jgi:hypothetical protein
VTNELTGRHIKMGGSTYKNLVDKGFVVDRAAGMLRSPEGAGGRAPPSSTPRSPGSHPRSKVGARRRSTQKPPPGDAGWAPGASTATSPF